MVPKNFITRTIAVGLAASWSTTDDPEVRFPGRVKTVFLIYLYYFGSVLCSCLTEHAKQLVKLIIDIYGDCNL